MKSNSKEIDMLHGPLLKKILVFALPLALSSMMQQLFNSIDVAVVGHFASREALAAVGLADTGKKRAGRFSMGMRQRLGLALALIARPRLLVLDEPTNGLDPIGIEELRDQIRGFAAAGTTVIVSSHILSEVQQMADTIGIIYGGRLSYEDALRPGQDLEELFMSVCREGRRACGEVAA